VWKRTVAGRTLSFHLAGINNQNFLMRDAETGTWWQQVSGKALFGPLAGQQLEFMRSDELTFGLWKQEAPEGLVLSPVSASEADYAKKDWDTRMAKRPVPENLHGGEFEPREQILGISVATASRAYPLSVVLKQSPLQDTLSGTPLVIVVGPDGKSLRAFVSRSGDAAVEFFRKTPATEWALVDSATGSQWDFQGCAVSGSAKGQCLEPLPLLREYWFDWRQYHPATTVYHRR
jgi:hypothetical protein